MADEADMSDERIRRGVDDKLAEITSRPPDAQYTGYCLSCGPDVKLPNPKRWCDADCREDWQKEQDRLKRL